jgi:SPP1 gp7 family putative phage head morphogenesis protein
LVQVGAQIPERYVHEETGIPTPAAGEPILAIAARSPASPVEPFAERPLSRAQVEPFDLRRAKRQAQDALIEAGVTRGQMIFGQLLAQLIDQVRQAKAIEQRLYNVELTVPGRPLRQLLVDTAVMAQLTGQDLAVEELRRKGVTFPPARLKAFAEEGEGIVGPEEAIRLFRHRLPIDQRTFNRLVGEARRKYFTVAGIEEANLLKIVQEALIEAIETGGTVDTFAQAVRERGVKYTGRAYGQALAGQDLLDTHVRLIFRTNVLSAYNDGRRAIFDDPEAREQIPFYLYSAIDDDRVRPSHAAMDGRIYRRDDPIWITWWPPNGYNCRCEVIPVTAEEAPRLQPEQLVTGPAVVDGQAVQPDPGFGGVA